MFTEAVLDPALRFHSEEWRLPGSFKSQRPKVLPEAAITL